MKAWSWRIGSIAGVPLARSQHVHAAAAGVVRADDTLATAARLILAGFQQDLPFVDGGKVVAILSIANLVRGWPGVRSDARASTGPASTIALSGPRVVRG